LFLLGIFATARTKHSQGLLGGDHNALCGANVILRLFADHAADSFAAFSAVYRGLVVPVHLRRGASARRDGVVHFRRIEAPTHTDDHANDLQQFAIDCQLPCNSHAQSLLSQVRHPPGKVNQPHPKAFVRGQKHHGGPAMIRKLPAGGFRLYSRKKDPKTGKRRNLGTFTTRAAAEKHEREVQYFKRAG
jgi:hypothetical protein